MRAVSVRLSRSETELTTAATDAVLGAVCLGCAFALWLTPARTGLGRSLWTAIFLLMACGAWLGAVAHGVQLAATTQVRIWPPLYTSLGLAVALVVVAAVRDWQGDQVARFLLPWAVSVGVASAVVNLWWGGSFLGFVVYEAVALLAALVIYGTLALRTQVNGAGTIAAGIVVSMLAAAIQASHLQARVLVRFDHNGLFHLVQIVATALIFAGARTRLR